jgi:hypothetical protein
LDYFCKSVFNFKPYNSYIREKVGKHEKKIEKLKKSRNRKENLIGFETDTEIGPYFQFQIQKPGLGCTLANSSPSLPILYRLHPMLYRIGTSNS